MTAPPDPPEKSPSLLGKAPKQGNGVRRLNNVPVLLAIGGAMLVAAAIAYNYRDRLMHATTAAGQAASHTPEPGTAAAVLSGAPAAGEVVPAMTRPSPSFPLAGLPHRAPDAAPPPIPSDMPQDGPSQGVQAAGEDEATKARREAWQAYYAQLAQLQKDRLAAAASAMTADSGLTGGGPTSAAAPAASAGATAIPASAGSSVPGYAGTAPAGFAGGFGTGAPPPAQVDAGAQREKQAFLNQPGDVTSSSDDLPASLRDPSSPYLVLAGTAIPALMVGGINSDMPGMVIGQVAENVYDTATGRYLLIPQGARLIGSYDNMVANGQTRVGVIWNRIVYPDTESIDLGAMEGADQGGYAGFHDLVDTHFWSKIGNALLISVASAGVQLSQPQVPVNGYYSSQQVAAAALGQQFGELGQEYARAGLSIPNTLKIRPGYRFVVMVNKDMHLRPYADHRTAGGTAGAPLGAIVQ